MASQSGLPALLLTKSLQPVYFHEMRAWLNDFIQKQENSDEIKCTEDGEGDFSPGDPDRNCPRRWGREAASIFYPAIKGRHPSQTICQFYRNAVDAGADLPPRGEADLQRADFYGRRSAPPFV